MAEEERNNTINTTMTLGIRTSTGILMSSEKVKVVVGLCPHCENVHASIDLVDQGVVLSWTLLKENADSFSKLFSDPVMVPLDDVIIVDDRQNKPSTH
jgi:hypothetical protein